MKDSPKLRQIALSFTLSNASNRFCFNLTHPLAKMFTLKRASHPYQGDAVTALWSQLWAFLGWYNAVQLVPRYGRGQVHGGLPGCLVAWKNVFSGFVVAHLLRMVIKWWSLKCFFDLFFFWFFDDCIFYFKKMSLLFGRCPRSLEKNNSLFTQHWLLGFQSHCQSVFNAIHLGSWMLIVPQIRHGIGNYSRRLGSLPPPLDGTLLTWSRWLNVQFEVFGD